MSAAIRAELIGQCVCGARGLIATADSPAVRMCRMLLEAGVDPDTPLHCFRGNVLALTVRSIGEGARIAINGKGSRFIWRTAVGTAPPVRQNAAPPHEPVRTFDPP
jgi:hypothetical protein